MPGGPRRPLFADLLRAVNEVEGIRRIRFTSPHPHDFTPDVIDAMAESEKVCEHIHFPLQSGSDRVLKAMQRSYRSERYLGWLERIRDRVPEVAVTTDIIVGFPGETEEDFAATLDVVERARFDQAYTFQYSPRPATKAGTMPDQIAKDVVQERFDRLVALQERISLQKMEAMRGRTVEVLVEGTGRKGGVQGRTRTNKVVHLPGEALPGTFLHARVGPTASGKSVAGIAVAESLGAEIVSVDSMLVYRGMDIGTAKPTPQDRLRIRHHLIDGNSRRINHCADAALSA